MHLLGTGLVQEDLAQMTFPAHIRSVVWGELLVPENDLLGSGSPCTQRSKLPGLLKTGTQAALTRHPASLGLVSGTGPCMDRPDHMWGLVGEHRLLKKKWFLAEFKERTQLKQKL